MRIVRFAVLATVITLLAMASGWVSFAVFAEPEESSAGQWCSAEETLEALRCLIEEGSYGEAEARGRELLERVEAESGKSSLEAARLLDLLVQARWRGGEAGSPETLRLAGRALAIKQTILGTDHEEVADSLVEMGNVFDARTDYEAARPLFLQALEIYERELGAEGSKTAVVLNNLGSLLRKLGEFEEARLHAERAITIYEQLYGPDDPYVADSLENLAIIIAEGALPGDFISLYRRSLAIREETYGPDHPKVANSLHNLGWELYSQGEWEEAKLLMERALQIREQVYGSESGAVADALGNYAILLSSMGYSEALSVWERALELGRSSFGPRHPSVGITLGNFALVVQGMGEYARARSLCEEALRIFESALGVEHLRVGWALNLLGGLLTELGDYEEAILLQERALEIFEQQVGPDHWLVPGTLINLGASQERAGRYPEARKLYQRAVAIGGRLSGADDPGVAGDLLHLAGLERRTGDYAGSRKLYERALAVQSNAYGLEDLRVAESLLGLAALHADLGDHAEAQRLFKRALEAQGTRLDSDHPEIGSTLRDLSMSLFQSGERARAFPVALRSEEISREHLRVTLRSLAEREGLRYASVGRSSLDLLLSLALDNGSPDTVRNAYDALIRSRALVLDEMAERHRAATSETDPEVVWLNSDLASARRRLATLYLRDPDPANAAPQRRMVEEARRQKESAERSLAQRSHSFRQESVRAKAGLNEVAAALPEDSGLVSFARFGRYGSESASGKKQGAPDPTPWYLAFVLARAGRQPPLVPLGPADEIDALVERLREQVSVVARDPRRSPKRAEAGYRTSGGELRERIWDPLEPHVGEFARLFVVPDGALNLVHFEALPIGDSDYLIDRQPDLHYLSAERDLLAWEDAPLGIGLLALGDPSFDETEPSELPESANALLAGLGPEPGPDRRALRGLRSSCAGFKSMRFERLPESDREVREVAALWKAAIGRGPTLRGGSAPRREATTLQGPAAAEGVFKELAPGKRVLHLATHGFFLDGLCASALESATRGSAGLDGRPITGENPLLLAGLALTGSNLRETKAPSEEDGILTAEEIASLDLSGVEWVVLSACDSGIGEVRAGEGVMGLRRAFRVAGARTVIMSLWPVEDEASRTWMTALYEQRFLNDLETTEAVRRASLDLLERRREGDESTHPFFWVGFIAEGDWR
jgi:tetratricopeptide (TPR) repeat protein/CHAT domain-containing protein